MFDGQSASENYTASVEERCNGNWVLFVPCLKRKVENHDLNTPDLSYDNQENVAPYYGVKRVGDVNDCPD